MPDIDLDILPRSAAQTGATCPVSASASFMLAHPAHLVALGFGAGLSPLAPGTVGTLWAWLSFALLQMWLSDGQWALLMLGALVLGWWAAALTARHLCVFDPACIVWDEIAAFWLILWLLAPSGFWGQFAAFALFRFFDAVKPGPVGWADQLYHAVDPSCDPAAWRKAGWGIMLDDYVAAFCTLLVISCWRVW